MNTQKDSRKVYSNERVNVNGTFIEFDGKYNPQTDTLKVYRLRGDVRLFDDAIQSFCIDNKIGKAVKA